MLHGARQRKMATDLPASHLPTTQHKQAVDTQSPTTTMQHGVGGERCPQIHPSHSMDREGHPEAHQLHGPPAVGATMMYKYVADIWERKRRRTD